MFYCGCCGNQAPLPCEAPADSPVKLSCWSTARRSDSNRVDMTHPHHLLNPPLRKQSPGESFHQSPRSFLPSFDRDRKKHAPAAADRGSRLWRSDTAVRSPPRGALKPGVCGGMVGHLTVYVSPVYQPRAAACKAAALLRHCQL